MKIIFIDYFKWAALSLILFLGCSNQKQESPAVFNSLIAASMEGKQLSQIPLSADDHANLSLTDALTYVNNHADESAYHLLAWIRTKDSKSYDTIAGAKKARVLCAAMERAIVLNDFGLLEPPVDGVSGLALVAIGRDALPELLTLLNDKSTAPVFGSEEATIADTLQYRLCDYAYRFASLILGRTPAFYDSPTKRDGMISDLRQDLQSFHKNK